MILWRPNYIGSDETRERLGCWYIRKTTIDTVFFLSILPFLAPPSPSTFLLLTSLRRLKTLAPGA